MLLVSDFVESHLGLSREVFESLCVCLLYVELLKPLKNCRQVVGWPPIRTYRMNSMVNQAKASATEDPNLEIRQEVNKNRTDATKMRNSMFVKVTMDGIPIGRKIDLNAHKCYESLSNTLEEMFLKPKLGTLFRILWPFFLVPFKSFLGMGNEVMIVSVIRFKHTRNRWSYGNTSQDTTRWVFRISTDVWRQGRRLDACWWRSVGVCIHIYLCFRCWINVSSKFWMSFFTCV